jgi:hypothetical protein
LRLAFFLVALWGAQAVPTRHDPELGAGRALPAPDSEQSANRNNLKYFYLFDKNTLDILVFADILITSRSNTASTQLNPNLIEIKQ